MNEESKNPDATSDVPPDVPEEEKVDNVVDEILDAVGGMNAMLDALDKSRPHLKEAGSVFLSALAKATREAHSTAESAREAADEEENSSNRKGAEIAARLFGVMDKVAQAAAPTGNEDPDAAEFRSTVVEDASALGAKLAEAMEQAAAVAAEKLSRDSQSPEAEDEEA